MKRLFLFTIFFLAACSPSVIPVSPTPTSTPEPTNTASPTTTPLPTAITSPTDTPVPPTATLPAQQSVPSYENEFFGEGNSRFEVDFPDDFVGVIHVIGNSQGGEFTVKNHDQDGELIGILVNSTEPYDGIRPLDFVNFQNTKEIEVNAEGSWEIKITDIFNAPFLNMPGGFTQSGDYVVVLGGGAPNSAYIRKDEAMGTFRILGYGNSMQVLFDTTEPVEGIIPISADIVALEIQAKGEWTIDVTPR